MPCIGDLEMARVEELVQAVPIALLGASESLIADQRDTLSPRFVSEDAATFWLTFQTWILRREGLTIVVDPCNGNGRERPLFPQFHRLDTPFLERFEATGIRPENVDFVFCTHLHCDHCGWNTRLRDGRWIPTFPNARYLFVRREAERWRPDLPGHKIVEYNIGVFEDSVLPIIEAGLADLVDDHHSVADGVSILPAYGHTLGHSILKVETGEANLYCTGDAFHHPLQITDPRLHLGGCDDLPAAIATRERLAELIAREDAIMLPAHFPAPHMGRVVHKGGVRHFEPLACEW